MILKYQNPKGVMIMCIKLNPKYRAELLGSERIKNYVLGGNGVVTLTSDVSGEHHTYSFQSPHDNSYSDKKFDADVIFIRTLVNDGEWVYVGMYKGGRFKLTAKSNFKVDSPIVKGVAYIFKMIINPDYADERMHLLHEGICCRCGRPLTNPESIELGIGPVCMDKM
jgi:hypothetical protein